MDVVAITVEDLLVQPHLRLELLAGSKGLGNVVTWTHSSDLPEPWDWLAGGELLMKNGRTLPRSVKAQMALIDGLAAARAAALVIGLDPATPTVTRGARAHADAVGLPLLQVPYAMSFIVLSRAVADATRSGDDGRRVSRAGRIYSTVRAAVAGSEPTAFLRRLEGELECRLFVLDQADAEPVLAGTGPPDRRMRAALLEAVASRGGALPALLRLPVAGRRMAVVVEVPYEEPTLLVAVSSTDRFDVLLLQHAAAATAVEMAHLAIRHYAEAQAGSELLRRLLDSPLEAASLEGELAEHGLDPSTATMLAVRGSDPEGRGRLQVALARRKIPYLEVTRGSLMFLLVSGTAAYQTVTLASERIGTAVTVGVSGPLGTTLRVGEAAREAAWMLSVAEGRGDPVGVYGQATSLPGLRDPAEAAAVVERVLGPLLAHDRDHHGQLVESLRTFLACRRSWQRSAVALAVHRQTVVYRMNQVRELTGRSLVETADLAELWTAVTALDLIDPPRAHAGEAPPPAT
jgi:PucR family transcriptional regulator, purine catabolism regulatory protein